MSNIRYYIIYNIQNQNEYRKDFILKMSNKFTIAVFNEIIRL